jgi:CHAD domain-containing protein
MLLPSIVQFHSPVNLIKCWTEFSAEWKNVRQKSSERHIHDLRVATRRAIAVTEIVFAITQDRRTRHLIRKFRKLLKRLGPLRELQVHLLKSELGSSSLMKHFSGFLKQREKAEIRRLRRRMQDSTRKALRRDVRATNRKLLKILERTSGPLLRATVEANVHKKVEAILAADTTFRQSRSIEDFHRLRIQFKRFRYAAEVAKPVTGSFTKRQLDAMRKLQQTMGEIHDLQTYMTALAEWSERTPPAMLRQELDRRMKAFIKSPEMFEAFRYLS